MTKIVGKIAADTVKGGRLPSRIELLKTVAKNPRSALKTAVMIDRIAVARGRAKTGQGRIGQARRIIGRSEIAKDLTVNIGGAVGSAAGSTAGPIGTLAGDNLGALGTRKIVNNAYALSRAKKKLGKGAPKALVIRQQQRYAKALKRLDRRKANNASDQVGWAVGNASAAALGSVPVPLKGGIVASRTVPSIVANLKKVKNGEMKPRDFFKETGISIAKANNLKKIVSRGNARERLLRQRINKVVKTGKFHYRSPHLARFRRASRKPILPSLRGYAYI